MSLSFIAQEGGQLKINSAAIKAIKDLDPNFTELLAVPPQKKKKSEHASMQL